jgi:hypothetical protein
MSGISSRLNYDNCSAEQQTKTSCAPANYSIYLDSFVNPGMKSAKDVLCLIADKNTGCESCDVNKVATLELGPQAFSQRADIEDNLRGIKRNLSQCASEKFLACEINAPNRIAGECNNVITVNPNLCDRSIVPTNIRFPTSKGF